MKTSMEHWCNDTFSSSCYSYKMDKRAKPGTTPIQCSFGNREALASKVPSLFESPKGYDWIRNSVPGPDTLTNFTVNVHIKLNECGSSRILLQPYATTLSLTFCVRALLTTILGLILACIDQTSYQSLTNCLSKSTGVTSGVQGGKQTPLQYFFYLRIFWVEEEQLQR